MLARWGRLLGAGEIAQLAAVLDSPPCQSRVRWYDNAKQNFLAGLTEPGHQSALAAAESWDRTVAFFAQHL